MTSVLVGFATIWAVITLGWVMARLRLLSDASQPTLANLAFYLGTPALLFLLMWRADLSQAFAPHLLASVAAMAVVALGHVAAQVLLWRDDLPTAVTATFGSFYVNAANIGIPIATYVLGDPTWSVPILLVQVAVLQPVGLAVLDVRNARDAGRPVRSWRRLSIPLRNPITIGAALGLVANVAHLALPRPVVAPVELIAQLAVPTMLVAFGVSLFTGGFPGTAPHTPEVAWITFLKLVGMPLAAYLLGRHAFGLDPHTLFAVTVMAGLPTAQNVFMNALRYDAGVAVARDVVFFTTTLSIPTLFAIALLARG